MISNYILISEWPQRSALRASFEYAEVLAAVEWASGKWKFHCHCGTKVAPATRAAMMTSNSCHWRSNSHTGWLQRQLKIEGVFAVLRCGQLAVVLHHCM